MRQVCATVVYGSHTELLERTFTSFRRNPFLELHAFILGDRLPQKRAAGVTYHLRPFDPSYSHPMRDADYRRWLLIDELEADYALVVDGCDALCLQPIPEIPLLLKGGWLAAAAEHPGSRYMEDVVYNGNFVNAGVTFWDIGASKGLREEVVARGRTRFRNREDDQMCLNEVVFARYLDRLTLLPCVYNYRAYLNRRVRGWPTTRTLDGVRIYHHDECLRALERGAPAKNPALPPLRADAGSLTAKQQFWRRLRQRLKPQVVSGSFMEGFRARWFR
ncbi:MAG: hypothetical protein ACYDC1_06245 [Limisphaerales bacterium]